MTDRMYESFLAVSINLVGSIGFGRLKRLMVPESLYGAPALIASSESL